MKKSLLFFTELILITGCKNFNTENKTESQRNFINEFSYFNPNGKTILERYNPPENSKRKTYNSTDFGYHLQHLLLKKFGEKVIYFDGKIKNKEFVYNGVIDLPIGKKDLHQCADATMRLRADYLYQNKMYDKISFNFISDGKPRTYLDYALNDFSEEKY